MSYFRSRVRNHCCLKSIKRPTNEFSKISEGGLRNSKSMLIGEEGYIIYRIWGIPYTVYGLLHQYLSNKLKNISFSAKIFCESEIQSQNLNRVLILCVAVSSKVCVFFSWFFKFHPSKSRNSKFRNQNKRVFLGIIFPAHTVEGRDLDES